MDGAYFFTTQGKRGKQNIYCATNKPRDKAGVEGPAYTLLKWKRLKAKEYKTMSIILLDKKSINATNHRIQWINNKVYGWCVKTD